MSADAFVAFYGLRYLILDEAVEAVEERTDARVIAARTARLQTHFGRLTDGEPYFLLVGIRLGIFGVENESARSIDSSELEQLMSETAAKLREAELPGTPQLHLQLEAQD